jgi:hypothetical protein
MDVFEARSTLADAGLFSYTRGAEEVLENFVAEFRSNDAFANQVRGNMASIGAAEFANLRRLVNGRFAPTPFEEVLAIDAQLAIVTADTLRTRVCRSIKRVETGGANAYDLAAFSGDATKIDLALREIGTSVSELKETEVFKALSARLYGSGEQTSWEEAQSRYIYEARIDAYSMLFAFLRLATVMNLSGPEARRGFDDLRKHFNVFLSGSSA